MVFVLLASAKQLHSELRNLPLIIGAAISINDQFTRNSSYCILLGVQLSNEFEVALLDLLQHLTYWLSRTRMKKMSVCTHPCEKLRIPA